MSFRLKSSCFFEGHFQWNIRYDGLSLNEPYYFYTVPFPCQRIKLNRQMIRVSNCTAVNPFQLDSSITSSCVVILPCVLVISYQNKLLSLFVTTYSHDFSNINLCMLFLRSLLMPRFFMVITVQFYYGAMIILIIAAQLCAGVQQILVAV